MPSLRVIRRLPARSGATDAEVAAALPGDELLPDALHVIDRAITLDAPAVRVWPWLVQLGKERAGWYLPRRVELLLPRRALRRIDPALQHVAIGSDVPDWGPGTPVLRLVSAERPKYLCYLSLRDRRNDHRWPAADDPDHVLAISWTLQLTDLGTQTRLHIRLRVRARNRTLAAAGGVFDWLTIVGLFAGLRERLRA